MESNSFWGKGYVHVLFTLILIAVLFALGAYAHLTLKQARGTYTGNTNISVSGEGEVLAKPDIAQFSFAVRAEADTATEAQTMSAEAMNQVIAYLKEAGVEEKDIKTQYYSLNPKYRYEERICAPNMYCPPGEQILDGYEVSQDVSVKVRDLEAAGNLISGVGERGATNISGLSFTIDDETELMSQAREMAIADAKEKAEALARDLGMRIDRIVGFSENGMYYPMYDKGYGGNMAMEEAYRMDAASAPSMPVGENTITSNVTITFELR